MEKLSLTTTFVMKENILIVRLQGELDHHEASILRDKWQATMRDHGTKHVVLNLAELNFMDSSGIGVVLGRYKEIMALGGELVVCAISPSLKRIFDMSGLFKIIRLEENEAVALHSLGVAV